jgi:hypothetical protein
MGTRRMPSPIALAGTVKIGRTNRLSGKLVRMAAMKSLNLEITGWLSPPTRLMSVVRWEEAGRLIGGPPGDLIGGVLEGVLHVGGEVFALQPELSGFEHGGGPHLPEIGLSRWANSLTPPWSAWIQPGKMLTALAKT